MNFERLRTRGWTEGEIAHAKAIFSTARATHAHLRIIEHATFWMLICAIAAGTAIVALKLIPIIVLATLPISLPITALFGSCMGLLLVHAMHDLHLERKHLHAGVSLLVIASITIVTVVLNGLNERMLIDQHAPSLAFAISFAIGLVLPYLAHWGLVHDAA